MDINGERALRHHIQDNARDLRSSCEREWTQPKQLSPTLLIVEALVCTAHGFSGMRDFLFWYGEEEWWDEVAEGREKGY